MIVVLLNCLTDLTFQRMLNSSYLFNCLKKISLFYSFPYRKSYKRCIAPYCLFSGSLIATLSFFYWKSVWQQLNKDGTHRWHILRNHCMLWTMLIVFQEYYLLLCQRYYCLNSTRRSLKAIRYDNYDPQCTLFVLWTCKGHIKRPLYLFSFLRRARIASQIQLLMLALLMHLKHG